jgi:serine/threonine protein kinase
VLIGHGGMGEVWEATHRFLARPAAIKLIKPDVLSAMTKQQGEVCIAYWMLTGRYVFTGDSSIQVVARHVSLTPVAPSRHSGFDISPALDELVLACLRKRPADRPASARELCDLLGQCEVEAAWTREDARRWWENRMMPEAAVVLVD